MPFSGYPDHNGGPEMYDDANPDETACARCGSTDDIQPYGPSRTLLCVPCAAAVREEDEKAAVPVAVEEEETTEVPAESMRDVVDGGRR
jgi:recombinational DNA repair protein (RecF pathway)